MVEVEVLVAAAFDPTEAAVRLRLLHHYDTAGDTALVGTSKRRPDHRPLSGINRKWRAFSMGIVDTTSTQSSVAAPYAEIAIVVTPSPSDLEREVLALADLDERTIPLQGERHLVIRSLTTILNATSLDCVRTVLNRISGLGSSGGLGLLGIDYTAHDESTMPALGAGMEWCGMG